MQVFLDSTGINQDAITGIIEINSGKRIVGNSIYRDRLPNLSVTV